MCVCVCVCVLCSVNDNDCVLCVCLCLATYKPSENESNNVSYRRCRRSLGARGKPPAQPRTPPPSAARVNPAIT